MDLDPKKTYDYHTAYDIQPAKVVYNVDLDMNQKKILNITPDKSHNNDAATKKLKLQTSGDDGGGSITVLDSFNGKRVVFWQTKKGAGFRLVVKATLTRLSF